jgi:hypothetical protein
MADVTYTGGASVVRDVFRLTPGGTIEIGDVFNVTLNGKTVSVAATVAGTTLAVANVTALLVAALTDADVPEEFDECEYTDAGTHVECLGPDDGRDIYSSISVATTESGGGGADAQTFAKSSVTAASGPYKLNLAANWLGGTTPSNGDTIHFGLYPIVPRYNLDAYTALTGTTVIMHAGTTAGLLLGLPRNNDLGYVEYLDRALELDGTTLIYGRDNGPFTPSLNINVGTVNNSSVIVEKSNNRDDNGDAPLYVIGGKASNTGTIQVRNGFADFGIGQADIGSTGEFASLIVVNQGDVRVGSGVTIPTIDTYDGDTGVESWGPSTTVTHRGSGVCRLWGTDGLTTLNNLGTGTVENNRIATVTNCKNYGTFDHTQAAGTRTYTNAVELYPSSIWNDPNRNVTPSGGYTAVGSEFNLGNGPRLNIGQGRTISITA